MFSKPAKPSKGLARRFILPYKLLITVLMVSSVLTVILSAGQLYWDYLLDMNALEESVTLVKETSLDLLASNIWEINKEQVQIGMQGIKSLQDIEYVHVDSRLQIEPLGQAPPQGARISEWTFDLVYHDKPHNDFVKVGQLRIVASLERIYKHILDKVLIVLFSHFMKTIIVSIFILGLVRMILTRHLLSIREFVEDYPETGSGAEIRLHRGQELFGKQRDEIDLVADTINHFIAVSRDQAASLQRELAHATTAEDKLKLSNEQLLVRLQEQLDIILKQRQFLEDSARLSALGKLAGGIAHEINNPLAIIDGNCHRFIDALDSAQGKLPATKPLESILKMVVRISAIVNSLRLYSKQDVEMTDVRESFPVKGIIDETILLCTERVARHNIKITVDSIDPRMRVRCNHVAISQIIINLINNSVDAIRDASERWIKVGFFAKADYIELSITDSGPGIPESIREKITDPFFTTKPVGKGTGLGLSISKAIALSHNGAFFLDANSENTRFVLRLPRDET